MEGQEPHIVRSAKELENLFSGGATAASCKELAFTLSHVVGADEQRLVSGLQSTDVVSQAVALARRTGLESKEEVAVHHSVLGALVNLACIGGVGLVKDQQGFDLMLDALRTDVFALRYYAVAGLQNMCGHDNECAWKVVQTNMIK